MSGLYSAEFDAADMHLENARAVAEHIRWTTVHSSVPGLVWTETFCVYEETRNPVFMKRNEAVRSYPFKEFLDVAIKIL